MRWVMYQAVFGVSLYLRWTSRAESPFLQEHISNTTNSHVRTGTLEPWKIVPVRTENCLRQAAHFQTRRSDVEPVRVLREAPFEGFRKYGGRSEPQCGQRGSSPQRSCSRNR